MVLLLGGMLACREEVVVLAGGGGPELCVGRAEDLWWKGRGAWVLVRKMDVGAVAEFGRWLGGAVP
jgi:hypothetical protein